MRVCANVCVWRIHTAAVRACDAVWVNYQGCCGDVTVWEVRERRQMSSADGYPAVSSSWDTQWNQMLRGAQQPCASANKLMLRISLPDPFLSYFSDWLVKSGGKHLNSWKTFIIIYNIVTEWKQLKEPLVADRKCDYSAEFSGTSHFIMSNKSNVYTYLLQM